MGRWRWLRSVRPGNDAWRALALDEGEMESKSTHIFTEYVVRIKSKKKVANVLYSRDEAIG